MIVFLLFLNFFSNEKQKITLSRVIHQNCPDPELNRDYSLRRTVSYPLNDRDTLWRMGCIIRISHKIASNIFLKTSPSSFLEKKGEILSTQFYCDFVVNQKITNRTKTSDVVVGASPYSYINMQETTKC